MSKQDFLNSLRAVLGNELGAAAAEENVKYYEEYISAQVRMGKSEDEVLRQLGNPKLIARSIIDARNSGAGENTAGGYENAGNYENVGNGSGGTSALKIRKMPLWLIIVLIVVIICLIFGALVMFVWWLAPVIIFVWLLTYVLKIFRGKK